MMAGDPAPLSATAMDAIDAAVMRDDYPHPVPAPADEPWLRSAVAVAVLAFLLMLMVAI